jgi:hypothetical protein
LVRPVVRGWLVVLLFAVIAVTIGLPSTGSGFCGRERFLLEWYAGSVCSL